jgi:hypothetical protein
LISLRGNRRSNDPQDIIERTTQPGSNIGLALEPSKVAAIDLDDLGMSREALALADVDIDALLAAPDAVRIIGREGRGKLLYRVPEGFECCSTKLVFGEKGKDERAIFELRYKGSNGNTVQDVMPPSQHPDTGRPYELVGDITKIPPLPQALADLWKHWEDWKPVLQSLDPHYAEVINKAKKIKPKAGAPQVKGAIDPIRVFNERHSIHEVLTRSGYKQRGKRRYIRPGNTSGVPGVVLLDDEHIYSHGGDVLADGYKHDAFDVYRLLACGGEWRQAFEWDPEITRHNERVWRETFGNVTDKEPPCVTEEPPPWEDPPVESYTDDPYAQGQDRNSRTRRGEKGEAGDRGQSEPEVTPWPKLHEAALEGIVGEIVRAATQNSEADPAAVLMTALVEAGATIGTGPHILISETVHHARLFSVLVGASSRARKGTSVAPVQRIFEAASQHIRRNSTLPFPGGLPLRISYGPLSSGEGLVYAVRDPVEVKGEDGEIKVVDEGVEDKRLLVIEGEFSAVLRACQREGNTLSAILRTAFDHGNIEPLTKHNRIKATGAHINFVGHITEHELHCLLTSIDVWNGFANRILWAAVRRTRQVPFPQPLSEEVVCKLSERLGAVLISRVEPGARGSASRGKAQVDTYLRGIDRR